MKAVCVIEACDRSVVAKGLCNMHRQRLAKHGDPTVVGQRHRFPHGHRFGARRVGENHPSWQGSGISYRAAHARVKALRGRAAEHLCACGEIADEWAYDHADPAEMTTIERGYVVAYSADPVHYRPMCRSCHRTLDHHANAYIEQQKS